MSTFWQGLLYQPDCHRCPLQRDKRVLPCGPVPAKLCYVGEGPGANEVVEGQGFVGESGQLLWKLAGHYRTKREDIWVSNAALCKPRDVDLGTGVRIPLLQVKDMSVRACRKRLIYELLYVTGGNPDAVIVPIGKLALRSLTPRINAGIMTYRGSVMKVDLHQLWKDVHQNSQSAW